MYATKVDEALIDSAGTVDRSRDRTFPQATINIMIESERTIPLRIIKA
jgi:hypothetical protein